MKRFCAPVMAIFAITAMLVGLTATSASAHVVHQNEVGVTCDTITAQYASFPHGQSTLTARGNVGDKEFTVRKSISGPQGQASFGISNLTHNMGPVHVAGAITWTADGGGSTSFSKNLNCGTPVHVPTLAATHTNPTCASNNYVITVTAGEGNTSTFVEIVSSPAWVLKSSHMSPNGTMTYSNSLKAGEHAEFTILQDSKQVDAFRITAPSDTTCHPVTTTTTMPTTTTTVPPVTVPPTITYTSSSECGQATIKINAIGGNTGVTVSLKSQIHGELLTAGNHTLQDASAAQVIDKLPNGGTDHLTLAYDGKSVSFSVTAKSLASCHTTKVTAPEQPKPTTTTQPVTTTTATPSGQLPFTGSSPVLPVAGFTATVAGAIALAIFGKRRKA